MKQLCIPPTTMLTFAGTTGAITVVADATVGSTFSGFVGRVRGSPRRSDAPSFVWLVVSLAVSFVGGGTGAGGFAATDACAAGVMGATLVTPATPATPATGAATVEFAGLAAPVAPLAPVAPVSPGAPVTPITPLVDRFIRDNESIRAPMVTGLGTSPD